MPRILLIALLVLALASTRATPVAARPPDSKAWGKVSTTTGPPRPGAVEDQRAKLAGLGPLVPSRQPGVAGRASRTPPPAELPSPDPGRTVETSRPYTGPELAGCEARIRAKLEAAARPAPTPPFAPSPGLAPPKPGVSPGPRAAAAVTGRHPAAVTRTEIPGTPLNEEQRAKLERARVRARTSAVRRPPLDRP